MPFMPTNVATTYLGAFKRPPTMKQSLQSAYDKARAANEARYGEILAGYQGRTGEVMGMLEQYGAQGYQDVLAQGPTGQSAARQSAISRGLTGTTVLTNLQRSAQQDHDARVARYIQALAGLKAQTYAGLRGETLGFMERRQDTYPDVGQYLGLLQQYGRYA